VELIDVKSCSILISHVDCTEEPHYHRYPVKLPIEYLAALMTSLIMIGESAIISRFVISFEPFRLHSSTAFPPNQKMLNSNYSI